MLEGFLPKWLLLVSSLAVLNGVQNFLDASFSAKVYSSPKGRSLGTCPEDGSGADRQ